MLARRRRQGERGERRAPPTLWFYSDQKPQKVGSSDFSLYSLQSECPKVADSLITIIFS